MKEGIGKGVLPGALFAACHFLSLPGYGLSFLAWAGWIPFLFLVEESETPHRALLRGFCAGLAAAVPLYYWIAWTVAVPGKIGWAAGIGAVLFVSAFVALHFGVAAWWAKRLLDRFGPPSLAAFPAVACAVELSRMYLFSGFPWMLTGYALAGDPYLRQGASVVGTVGLGAILATPASLAYAALRHGRSLRRRLPLLVVAAALPALLFAWGKERAATLADDRSRSLALSQGRSVAVVQGSVDQSVKWEPAFRAETLRIYGDLSEKAAPGRDLLVWPETAAPFFYGWEAEETARLRAIAAAGKVPILFGVPWMEEEGGKVRFYNSVLLLDGDGIEGGRYDKRHLVPFGEYVPLRFLLGFMDKLTGGGEDFSRGKGAGVIRAAGMRLGPSVCYEAIFPAIQREEVLSGANVLVNVTNDAWFGDTVAPWQHLAMSRMRAVETGRPLVRAANSGVSAFVGPGGELEGTLGLSVRGILGGTVVPRGEVTPYVKWGDVLPGGCCIIAVSLLAFTFKRKPCLRD